MREKETVMLTNPSPEKKKEPPAPTNTTKDDNRTVDNDTFSGRLTGEQLAPTASKTSSAMKRAHKALEEEENYKLFIEKRSHKKPRLTHILNTAGRVMQVLLKQPDLP